MDVQSDYAEFRSLLREHVEDILLRQPEVAKGRWEFACYRSMAVFEATFPNPKRRADLLRKLAATTREIDEAVRIASEKVSQLGNWGIGDSR